MRLTRSLLVLTLACAALLVPGQAGAQTAAAEVEGVVHRLFDAMRTGDSTALRSVLHPQVRLLTAATREGRPALQSEDPEAFVRAVGAPRTEAWDERVRGIEVRVDGALATAWMEYDFYVGERFSHCGVNAFQLFREEAGWQVIQIVDTRRRTGCRGEAAR